MNVLQAILGIILLISLPTHAGAGAESSSSTSRPVDDRPDSVPDDTTLEAGGALIGAVEIRTYDIFDTEIPGEDRWLYRTANRLHWKTREGVVRSQLLFKEGDPYRGRLLAESERLLREMKYLYEATIRPVKYENGKVNVKVATRDVWTLQAGFGFRRTGGSNSTRIGIQDSNFLGMGKDLTVRRTSDIDRTEVLYRYMDPQVLGSRVRMQARYSDNSDGVLRSLDVAKPFHSLDTRWAVGAGISSFDRVDSLYSRGEVTGSFRHLEEYFEIHSGFSRGLLEGRTRRWFAGFTREKDRFLPAVGNDPAAAMPEDRLLSYPWIGFESISEDFIKIWNLDSLQRTEDLNFGHEFAARLGFSSTRFGAERNQAVFLSGVKIGLAPRPGWILFLSGHARGRHGEGGNENVLAGGQVRFYARDFGEHIFHVSLKLDAASRLDGEYQLLLGGDRGLRGYPLRYADGDRRFLLTVEQRFYSSWYPFRLFHVGGAVFLDVGRAWFSGGEGAFDPGVLKDVGFGLRIGSSRSARASMVHIDLAFPLDREGDIRSMQVLVSTRETF